MVIAKADASKRTQNKIKELGPTLLRVHYEEVWMQFDGVMKRAGLFRLQNNGWLGWLPLDEIEVTDEQT